MGLKPPWPWVSAISTWQQRPALNIHISQMENEEAAVQRLSNKELGIVFTYGMTGYSCHHRKGMYLFVLLLEMHCLLQWVWCLKSRNTIQALRWVELGWKDEQQSWLLQSEKSYIRLSLSQFWFGFACGAIWYDQKPPLKSKVNHLDYLPAA